MMPDEAVRNKLTCTVSLRSKYGTLEDGDLSVLQHLHPGNANKMDG